MENSEVTNSGLLSPVWNKENKRGSTRRLGKVSASDLSMPSTEIENTSSGRLSRIGADRRSTIFKVFDKTARLFSIGQFDPKSRRSTVDQEESIEMFHGPETLIYTKHKVLPTKNFSSDPMHQEAFERVVGNMYVIQDLHEVHLDVIVDSLLTLVLPECQDNPIILNKLRRRIFTSGLMQQLNGTLQGIREFDGVVDYDQNWITITCYSRALSENRVGIAKLNKPTNLGRHYQDCQFVMLIIVPHSVMGTREETESARTFGTLMSDPALRTQLVDARTIENFKAAFSLKAAEFAQHPSMCSQHGYMHIVDPEQARIGFLGGLIGDFKRRMPHYCSDFVDGVRDMKSAEKTISCSMLLYFICILPSIAFGVLNESLTNGAINVEKVLLSQTFGGLVFAFMGGTPHIVLTTTAPLAIFAGTVYKISEDFGLSFSALYACVGLWNVFFLLMYSVLGLSFITHYSTRSCEEIFAMFISVAFVVDAVKSVSKNFKEYYFADECREDYNTTAATLMKNASSSGKDSDPGQGVTELPICHRDISILYILLLLGTVWVGIVLYNFTRTPYLTAGKREFVADYSLPIAVTIMSVVGYFGFSDVNIPHSFEKTKKPLFIMGDLSSLSSGSVFAGMGLGFSLSLLFFMDQNISASMINHPQNKLKKGSSYHWDLMVVALINVVPSLFTFPMIHAALPHSPLHLRALADVEERVVEGQVHETVVHVRETRLGGILSHVLIGASMALMDQLRYIPGAVLYGLFLYVAITPLYRNQMFERIVLLFTEEAAYPPTSYIRRIPQRKLHLFTVLQILQLLILSFAGFSGYSYLKMIFPILIFLLIPIRHYCLPRIIELEYLNVLDFCT